MTSKAWEESFAVPELVRKAVADRGWNPLNFALLKNKEILGTKRAQIEQQATDIRNQVEVASNLPTATPNLPTATVKQKDDSNLIIEINDGKGTAKVCVSALVEIVLRNGGLENRGQELVRGEQIQKDLLDLTKWTSGHLVSQRRHCLTTVEILHAARQREQQKKSKEFQQNENRRKKQGALTKLLEKVAQLINDRPELDFNKWNVTDCKGYLQSAVLQKYSIFGTSFVIIIFNTTTRVVIC